jgi:hypothetical protein
MLESLHEDKQMNINTTISYELCDKINEPCLDLRCTGIADVLFMKFSLSADVYK